MLQITIGNRAIGPRHPVFCIAELSGNAGQDFDRAVQLVYAAREAGADAVKTQCFTPDAMTLQSDAEPLRLTWAGRPTTLWELYSQTAMPLDWHSRLKALAESLDMLYFATLFDENGVDFMNSLGAPCFKVASFEITDLNLVRYTAAKGKLLMLSTGMATAAELDAALAAIAGKPHGAYPPGIALLHCVSAYPASPMDCNLRTIPHLATLNLPYSPIVVGLSDHTLGIAVPVAAVALGACIVEKHLTLSRADGGPDAEFSLEPAEFKAMVEAVRTVEMALGEVRYGPTEAEQPMLRFRRSLWVVVDVAAGERFTPASVRSLRPASGLEPKHLDEVLGRVATRNIAAGTPLAWDMVAEC